MMPLPDNGVHKIIWVVLPGRMCLLPHLLIYISLDQWYLFYTFICNLVLLFGAQIVPLGTLLVGFCVPFTSHHYYCGSFLVLPYFQHLQGAVAHFIYFLPPVLESAISIRSLLCIIFYLMGNFILGHNSGSKSIFIFLPNSFLVFLSSPCTANEVWV